MSSGAPNPIRASIVAEPFAWPGGYERWALTDDGGQLCHRCCEREAASIDDATAGDGWNVVAALATCEVDDCSRCDHCGAHLPGTGCEHT